MQEELDPIARAFVSFADETAEASPLYAALSPAVARDRELLALMLQAPPTQRRANLLFAVVHDLLLAAVEHPLARYYPSVTEEARPPDRAAFADLRDFCLSRRGLLRERIAARRTQTNEVRRSAAFLPVLQHLGVESPLALLEVGASAGLNLLVDRYRYSYGAGAWTGALDSPVAIECAARGAPPPVRPEPPRIAYRVGLDSHPLDVRSPADARWLMACVWPEETDRLQLLQAALEVARTSPPRVVAGDAVGALEEVVGAVPEELPLCLFHSATLPYLGDLERTAFVRTLDRLARERTLYWLSLEGGGPQTFGAELPFDRLHVPRPGDRATDCFGLLGFARWSDRERRSSLLARVDMHGRWIEWSRDP